MTIKGKGTEESPWSLKTPAGRGAEYQVWKDESADPPALVCQVGKTRLSYKLQCLEDLQEKLADHGDWMLLGSADEKQSAKDDSVEAWARSSDNPVGGWYGLRKGFRGRFANYVPPVLAALGQVEFEKQGRSMFVRAL